MKPLFNILCFLVIFLLFWQLTPLVVPYNFVAVAAILLLLAWVNDSWKIIGNALMVILGFESLSSENSSGVGSRSGHQEYVNKMLGKSIDYDGAYGDQCVDLARDYNQQVCGKSWSTRGHAINHWRQGMKGWKRVKNSSSAIPNPGDTIYFDTGPYGHVAIVHEADKKNVTVLEQNAGDGSGSGKGANAIRLKTYRNYTGVVGWFTTNT